MIKLHLGCGNKNLQGWLNYDKNLDITQKLPFADNSVDFVFTEHVVEHITQQEAYLFFKEVKRILKPNGVYRIIVPSPKRIYEKSTDDYLKFVKEIGKTSAIVDKEYAVDNIIFGFGHKSIWTEEILTSLLEIIGFNCYSVEQSESNYYELIDIDSHWKSITKEFDFIESIRFEAIKK